MRLVHPALFRTMGLAAAVGALLGSLASVAVAAEALRFEIPIGCSLGETCFVQNYVDVDPGPGALDFNCGPLTYNRHKGTDFRILDLKEMERGVAVLAAAPGKILRLRDGVPDGFPRDVGKKNLKGRECGNGVVIGHGGGWQTQYCHMRMDSITVSRGQRAKAGEKIGLVGMSGRAEFPHLHFGVRHKNGVIDPYTGPEQATSCNGPHRPLWSAEALPRLEYRPSGLLNAGFTSDKPTLRGIEEGRYQDRLPSRRSNLFFYVRLFGLQKGDQAALLITGPEGRPLVEKQLKPAEKNKAQWMQFVGRRAPKGGWPKGTYRAEFQLLRNSRIVVREVREVELR